MRDEIETLDAEIAAFFAEAFSLTARALQKLAEFDRREYWAALGYQSCAHWLNFRIGISLGAAREHVRVARALEVLPETSAKFSAGTLSFSKVRALTRIANADTDGELAAMAGHMTASQVEKVVRGCRRIGAEQAKQQLQDRSVQVGFDDEGMFFMRVRLLPDEGARLMQSLDTAMPDDCSRSVEQRRADALMALGSEQTATELIVHVEAQVEAQPVARQQDLHHIETPHGGRVSVSEPTARRLGCDASVLEMTHDAEGGVASVGRRTRKIPAGMRRALCERDRGCRFPGCSNRRVDNHHVKHWQDGGETGVANLLQLCRWHHQRVHEGGYRVELGPRGEARFFDDAGAVVGPPKPLPSISPPTLFRATPWGGVDWTFAELEVGLVVSTLASQQPAR